MAVIKYKDPITGEWISIKGGGTVSGSGGGKTAYEYAQDGGYTGTEEEFAKKLAEDTAPFVITVTGDGESGYTADKTGAEIKAAYSDNCRMVCNFGSINAIPLTSSNMLANLLAQRFTFHSTNGTDYHTVNILVYPNATITISVSSGTHSTGTSALKPLTINGTTYNGSSAVTIDTTDFVVTVSGDPESGFSANKSFAEISNAYAIGRTVVCYLEMLGALCPLLALPSEDSPVFSFALSMGTMFSIAVYIASDNSVMMEELYSMITIGDQTWIGDVVDFTDTINGMIDAKAKQGQGIHYIVGNSTTAGTWTGTCSDITEYYEGLAILYKLNVAGASNGSTLNINNLGAKPVYRNASTAVTTTYAVGSVLLLTYSDGAWLIADYDANTKTSAGSSNKTGTKMYLVGATSQNSSGVTTYSNTNCYIGTNNRLYSGGAVVPNTTEIEALIDTKLGVIENGSY